MCPTVVLFLDHIPYIYKTKNTRVCVCDVYMYLHSVYIHLRVDVRTRGHIYVCQFE